ncbi:MAG TPA: homocysteine S-methyltransferase family protein [Alphaproteobacteria bacterium]|jgi:betaine-homocysteine S-methyltransferase|nr:homocysteine S-methyltransferase family protein [Alphaproteobacteria bacterium]HJO13233.1 homocysteine S-methyltransferase family protein [Alphaproteobacteria bacterium]|tara:strand:- start:2800 stop:3840 length:1041 start_codon:yes stop_codon:yes gene_type:complete
MKEDLLSRLNKGTVLCAEGYLFAMERRGYLQAGAFVPEVVLKNPEVVTQLHREFIRAGSDVVQAFTYYGHREKLRIIGKEDLLEPLQKQALNIAHNAAKEFPDLDLLVCGDVANTNIYDPNDKNSFKECQKMYEEQIAWAKEAKVDFVVAETISWVEEMKIALKAIKDEGFIAVANFAIPRGDKTRDGYSAEDACKIVEDLGAEVVGLNCYRGPQTTMPLLKKVREKVSCHVAGLPVPYRTTEKDPTFLNIHDHACDCIPGNNAFPVALDSFYCNRYEMAEFAKECMQNKINFIGVCCGAEPHHVREMSVAIGKKPISYEFYPDMSKHFHHGTDSSLKKVNKEIKY